jgi:S1-C subfamily serine protease
MMQRGCEVGVRRGAGSMARFLSMQRKLGMTLREIDEALAASLSLKESNGLLVVGTKPGGAAEKAGMLWGDVVLEVNYTPLHTCGDFNKAFVSHAPGMPSRFLVCRSGNLRFVELWFDNHSRRKVSASPTCAPR